MDTQAARLKAARLAAGYKTAREAWEKFQWNPNTYRAHEAGPREIGKAQAIEYAAAFNVDLMWLLTGLEPPASSVDTPPATGTADIVLSLTAQSIGVRLVPVLDKNCFGVMDQQRHRLSELATGYVAIADHGLSADVFAYRITDKAMDGPAPHALALDDIVIVDRLAALEPGCIVIAGLPNHQIVVRQYGEAASPNGVAPLVTLIPVNTVYAPQTLERQQLAWIYRVVFVQRRL